MGFFCIFALAKNNKNMQNSQIIKFRKHLASTTRKLNLKKDTQEIFGLIVAEGYINASNNNEDPFKNGIPISYRKTSKYLKNFRANSRKTIGRRFEELKSAGLVNIQFNGKGLANTFKINDEYLPDCFSEGGAKCPPKYIYDTEPPVKKENFKRKKISENSKFSNNNKKIDFATETIRKEQNFARPQVEPKEKKPKNDTWEEKLARSLRDNEPPKKIPLKKLTDKKSIENCLKKYDKEEVQKLIITQVLAHSHHLFLTKNFKRQSFQNWFRAIEKLKRYLGFKAPVISLKFSVNRIFILFNDIPKIEKYLAQKTSYKLGNPAVYFDFTRKKQSYRYFYDNKPKPAKYPKVTNETMEWYEDLKRGKMNESQFAQKVLSICSNDLRLKMAYENGAMEKYKFKIRKFLEKNTHDDISSEKPVAIHDRTYTNSQQNRRNFSKKTTSPDTPVGTEKMQMFFAKSLVKTGLEKIDDKDRKKEIENYKRNVYSSKKHNGYISTEKKQMIIQNRSVKTDSEKNNRKKEIERFIKKYKKNT